MNTPIIAGGIGALAGFAAGFFAIYWLAVRRFSIKRKTSRRAAIYYWCAYIAALTVATACAGVGSELGYSLGSSSPIRWEFVYRHLLGGVVAWPPMIAMVGFIISRFVSDVPSNTFTAKAQELDEAEYAALLKEAQGSERRDGLWAKCMVETGGNEEATVACYIKTRIFEMQKPPQAGSSITSETQPSNKVAYYRELKRKSASSYALKALVTAAFLGSFAYFLSDWTLPGGQLLSSPAQGPKFFSLGMCTVCKNESCSPMQLFTGISIHPEISSHLLYIKQKNGEVITRKPSADEACEYGGTFGSAYALSCKGRTPFESPPENSAALNYHFDGKTLTYRHKSNYSFDRNVTVVTCPTN